MLYAVAADHIVKGRVIFPGAGYLEFTEGVTQQAISIDIKDTGAYHRDEDFQLVLTSVSGGARLVTDTQSRTRRAT